MGIHATSRVILPPPSTRICLDVDTSAGAWSFGSPRDANFAFAADIEVNDSAPMPPNLASRRSPWQVGFIQNLVSETRISRYDGMAPVSLSISRPCLDASSHSLPWVYGREENVLNFGTVQGVNSFWFQGPGKPVNFQISMVDWPKFTVFNFFGGGSAPAVNSHQIRSVECIRRFRTWIAAREEMSPANVVSSYTLLQMIDFSIKVTITLSAPGANPLFRTEFRGIVAGTSQPLPPFATLDVAAEYGTGVGSGFAQRDLRWGPPPANIQPVVVGPLANDFYPPQIHAQNPNVSPQFISLTSAVRCLS